MIKIPVALKRVLTNFTLAHILSVASAISGGLVAGDPALAVSSYLAHTPTDIVDSLIATQTSVTVHGSSRAAIRQADTPDDYSRNPDSSLRPPTHRYRWLTGVVPGQRSRRMRDSNSRGVAPNTLSKSAAVRSAMSTTVRDLHVAVEAVRAGRN